MTVVRKRKIRTALRTNQIVWFVTVPAQGYVNTQLKFQELGHSFSLYRPPSRQITHISLVFGLCCREETNKEEDEALLQEELAEELQERR